MTETVDRRNGFVSMYFVSFHSRWLEDIRMFVLFAVLRYLAEELKADESEIERDVSQAVAIRRAMDELRKDRRFVSFSREVRSPSLLPHPALLPHPPLYLPTTLSSALFSSLLYGELARRFSRWFSPNISTFFMLFLQGRGHHLDKLTPRVKGRLLYIVG